MRTETEVAAMQCPVCRVPLAMSDRQGIEIDYCPQCRGVWLDRGELAARVAVADSRIEEAALREGFAEGLGDRRGHAGVAVAPAADELDVEREPGGMVVETPDHGRGHGGETHEPPTLS